MTLRAVPEPPCDDGWDEAEPVPDRERLATPREGDWSTYRVPARRAPEAARTGDTIRGVLAAWASWGPLTHEPTGIRGLDEVTGGGLVYGTRCYIAGAPDVGKTILLIWLAHVWAGRGVVVGILAVDEEPGDMVARLAQRKGYPRTDTEVRDPGTLARMAADLGDLPIRFYDASWTIEAAAADVRAFAGQGKAALLVDSVQTVECEAERAAERPLDETRAVTARTRAIRAVAAAHKLIAVATSELGRAAYVNDEARRTVSTMAAGKWSGSIEYSARVLIGVRSVAGEPDLIDLEIAKNKHGPSGGHVYVQIDRRSQSLWQVDHAPPPPEVVSEERAARKQEAKDKRGRHLAEADLEAARAIVSERPGIGAVAFRGEFKIRTGGGKDRADAARGAARFVERKVKGRGLGFYLPGSEPSSEEAGP